MLTAGMVHVFEERLKIFTRLGFCLLKKIADMNGAAVLEALFTDMLASDGTNLEQKQHLFDSFLQKWKRRVDDAYTPKDSADAEILSALVDTAIGNFIADWKAWTDPNNAPSHIAGVGAGIKRDAGPGATDGRAAVSASSQGVDPVPVPAGLRHSLRAGETVFYHHPLYIVGEKRSRCYTKITATRNLGADGGGGTGGVRVKMQAETGEMVGVARYMEVCFADGANIDEDHGVQRMLECNGVLFYPMRPMLDLKEYHLVPSVAPAHPPGSTRIDILASLLPLETAPGADRGATKDDTDSAVKQASRERAQGSKSVLSSSSQHAKRRVPHACRAGTKKRKKVRPVSGYNLYYSKNYGCILQEVLLTDRFKTRPTEQQMNQKREKKGRGKPLYLWWQENGKR
jgi:hypothetical protein